MVYSIIMFKFLGQRLIDKNDRAYVIHIVHSIENEDYIVYGFTQKNKEIYSMTNEINQIVSKIDKKEKHYYWELIFSKIKEWKDIDGQVWDLSSEDVIIPSEFNFNINKELSVKILYDLVPVKKMP